MASCPFCETPIVEGSPAGALCPTCGRQVPLGGSAPKFSPLATPEVTASFDSSMSDEIKEAAGIGPGSRSRPATSKSLASDDHPRTVTIAPRKLSMNDIELLTHTWSSVASPDANPQATIKLDSKSASGMGSSLVVNPRGVRSSKEPMPTTTGADYELLEIIGKGGMGVVFSARQASVDRLVAIKMIRPNVAADAQQREKFLSEAVVTGDLDHPNIVPIYELGTNEQDALFYSMKRVQGTPWSKVIGEKVLSENLEILMKVADAVAFAHANGVVHRDLKPDNVMLGDFGEVLVMDWGLALATPKFRHSEFVTSAESMGGTPAYMAPEMAIGPFELIGPTSDVYLLGALLFEVVTRRRPHQGNSAQECLLAAARNEIQATEESGELLEIAYRAMATDPADRFQSVRDLQSAVRDYQSHCESISLATRADSELAQAEITGAYQSFARALFGFQEAFALWDGNVRAQAGMSEAKLAYAESARIKGDYELGMSLLDADNAAHAKLRASLETAQRERSARQKWLGRFKRIAAALAVIVFGVITIALIAVNEARDQEAAAKNEAIRNEKAAKRAEQEAREAESIAEKAREEETAQKLIAKAAEANALKQKAAADAAKIAAEEAEKNERIQKLEAKKAQTRAEEEEQKAIRAKQSEEYEAYVTRIGMAAAKINDNAFDTGASLLAACQPMELRNWEWGYLKRLCNQGINFEAKGTVNGVAFASDGKWFVTAGDDRHAHLWDLATGRERLPAIDHGDAIHGVAISPDGQLVATAGDDGCVRIASAKDGSPVRALKGHDHRVLGVAFSPRDGRLLVSCSSDKTCRVWDTATGQEIKGSPLRGHYGPVWAADFSPSEEQIATAGQDGKVIIWSFDPKRKDPWFRDRVFLGHEGPVFAAAFSPDGRQVVSAGHDKRVLIWQADKIKDVDLKQLVANEPVEQQTSRSLEGHSAPVRGVRFSADGQSVLSGGDDNTVRTWDAMTGKVRTVLRGHSRPVQSCAFSPDGGRVLSGGQEGQIKLWSLLDYKEVRAAQGRVLQGHDDAILSAAFSADGLTIVTASRDHTAAVYETRTAKRLRELKEGHEFLASRAIFFRGGRRLLTAAGDSSVRIWDAATGTQLHFIEGTGRAAAVAVSRDSMWLLTGKSGVREDRDSPDRQPLDSPTQGDDDAPRITLWDLVDGKSPRPHVFVNHQFGTGHRATVTAVAIAPDGSRLFSGDGAGMGKLWDSATGAELATLRGHTSEITDACFSPDGRRLLTSSNDGTVAQWDVAAGKELPLILALTDPSQRGTYVAAVKGLAISPNGKQVLTLSQDTQGAARQSVVRLWNVEQGKLLREMYRGGEMITSVAFADAGRAAIAAGSQRRSDSAGIASVNSVVRRWNLETGREELKGEDAFLDFKGRQTSIWSAIETPEGDGLLTVGGNGAAIWNPRDPETPERVFKPHSGVTSANFSPDGRYIVSGGSDHRAKIWNAKTGIGEFQLPAEHTKQINSAVFSPVDKRLLLTAGDDGRAILWDIAARRMLRALDHRRPGALVKPVRYANFSPDGRNVLTACEDAKVRIWETATGRQSGVVELDSAVLCAAYSHDGRRIIAGGANGKAIVLDARTLQPLVRYLGHTAAIDSVAFSTDGLRAITGSRDQTAKIWDTIANDAHQTDEDRRQAAAGPRDGKEILTLKHHDQAVTSVAFSPDGRSVLTASLDGTAVLWLTDDWKEPPAKE